MGGDRGIVEAAAAAAFARKACLTSGGNARIRGSIASCGKNVARRCSVVVLAVLTCEEGLLVVVTVVTGVGFDVGSDSSQGLKGLLLLVGLLAWFSSSLWLDSGCSWFLALKRIFGCMDPAEEAGLGVLRDRMVIKKGLPYAKAW